MDVSQFIARQQDILEVLFPEGWFQEPAHRDHPAYRRWDLCSRLLKQAGKLRYPEQSDELAELGHVSLDVLPFIELSGGNLQELHANPLETIGDSSVVNKIRSRVTNPTQYDDIMVELYVAAWHKTKGHTVELTETRGHPDMRIFNSPNKPLLIECKNLRTSSLERYQKVLTKANIQLTRGLQDIRNGHAALIVDISAIVGIHSVETDDLPEKVNSLIGFTRRMLPRPRFRTIEAVTLVWDDLMLKGTPPDDTLVTYRRRQETVSNPQLQNVSADRPPIFEGFTVAYWLRWSPNLVGKSRIGFSELFISEFEGKLKMPRTEVVDALLSSDESEDLVRDERRTVTLYLRKARSNLPCLLICAERVGETLVVQWAFRLPESVTKTTDYVSPSQLAERFANAYGLAFTIGTRTAKCLTFRAVSVSDTDPTRLVQVHNPDNHTFTMILAVNLTGTPPNAIAYCTLAFCIDITKYTHEILLPDGPS